MLNKYIAQQTQSGMSTLSSRQILDDFHAELDEIQEAQGIIGQLEYLEANADGSNPAVLVAAINSVLADVPALQLDLPSLESETANMSIAMEGLGDILGKLKGYLADKWEDLKQKMTKFKDAITWAFRDQVSRCEKLLEEFNSRELIAGGDIAVPKGQMLFLQRGGKRSNDVVGDFQVFAKEVNSIYAEKPLEVQLKELEKGTWKTDFDALKAFDRAYRAFLTATQSTEKNVPRSVTIKKPYIGYATPQLLGGFSHLSIMTQMSLGDGKTKVLRFINQRSIADAEKVAERAGTTMPALNKASLVKLIETIKDSSVYAEKNIPILWELYDRIDDIFGVVIEQTKDGDFSRANFENIKAMTYSVHWSSVYYMELMLNGFEQCCDNLIKFAKMHVK